MPHLTAIRLLTILGVDLGLDWDDELLVTCPEFITGNTLEDVVREHSHGDHRARRAGEAAIRRRAVQRQTARRELRPRMLSGGEGGTAEVGGLSLPTRRPRNLPRLGDVGEEGTPR